ncbi:MAG: hypothetical protein LBL18_04785 [Bacteroidales bacterium]|jgi:hypothetical protein|nr:hypothetical protein [Bacteroidales bacterium]
MKHIIFMLMAACVLLASSCKKPEELEIQNKPQRPVGETPDSTVVPKQRIERWVELAMWEPSCGYTLCYYPYNSAVNLYDSTMGAIDINWTTKTYRDHGVYIPQYGTYYPIRAGSFTYIDNNDNPEVFDRIIFEDGTNLWGNTKEWKISYYGDSTSIPAQPFDFTVFYTTSYHIPNQFIVLENLYGSVIKYFALVNYPKE